LVTITIKGSLCTIDAPDPVIRKVYALLSFKKKDAYWASSASNSGWDGVYHLLSKLKSGNKFKLGLLYRVLHFLTLENIPFQIDDQRGYRPNFQWHYLDPQRTLFMSKEGQPVKLRDVQIESVKRFCSEYYGLHLGRGIFSMPPRSGKSITACVLSQVIDDYPVMFVVHKIDLAYQAKKTFELILKEKVGIVGDGHFDVSDCKFIVATIQSIANAFGIVDKKDTDEKEVKDTTHYDDIKEFVNTVKVLLIDECHIAGSNLVQQLPNLARQVRYVAGFSGTPSRDDGADLLVEQLCGSIVYQLSKEEAVEKGYILPCVIYAVDLPSIHMPNSTWTQQEKLAIKNNPHIVDSVVKLVTRLQKKNLSCVVNVKKVEQGKAIQKALGCEFLHGKVSGEKRAEIYDKLQRKEILTIVSTVTDIGVDIPSLDCVIIANVTKSKVSAIQWIRCNTPYEDKKFGYVFVLCPTVSGADTNYVGKHSASMKYLYNEESTYKVIRKRIDEL
jgi:superfamily II DNA or RNA helicase